MRPLERLSLKRADLLWSGRRQTFPNDRRCRSFFMILSAHSTAAATSDSVLGLGLGIEEVLGRLKMTRHQDSGHNREHTLTSFFHARSVSDSLFVRLTKSVGSLKVRALDSASNPCRDVARQDNSGPVALCLRPHQVAEQRSGSPSALCLGIQGQELPFHSAKQSRLPHLHPRMADSRIRCLTHRCNSRGCSSACSGFWPTAASRPRRSKISVSVARPG